MSAGVEQVQAQPKTAGAAAVQQPFADTNAILAAAAQAGKLARTEALATKCGPLDAACHGHAVHVSRLAKAIGDMQLERDALRKALDEIAGNDPFGVSSAGGTARAALASVERAA